MIAASEIGMITCRACARVWPADRPTCGRCGHHLRAASSRSLQWVWAFWLTGLIAYIPANLYPMLVTSTLTGTTSSTIIGGAVDIARHGDFAVAAIVLIASVVIPVGKFIAIAYLALSVRRSAAQTRHQRLHLYEAVEFIGRWSMIDVFVVAILSALVQLSVIASIEPGPAALTFALSVIFTMLSARSFDTRLIWRAEA